ncbi:MAG TPA: hypothetical protein DDZ81_25390 [Acetobacteraceae bacterium]|jgi:hypothetical protein|nr:hypothetical protein [Acetobacteraceae bacterium]
MDHAIEAACTTLMPFALLASNDDPAKARATITAMIQAYNPADTIELGLIGRIVGFSLAAMENLRLSMADPHMPDAKVLRCRASAASLSRSAEQCRAALNALRAAPKPEQRPPAPPKARAPLSRPSDAQTAKAESDAKIILDRLTQLHQEWNPDQRAPAPEAPAPDRTPRFGAPPSGYG